MTIRASLVSLSLVIVPFTAAAQATDPATPAPAKPAAAESPPAAPPTENKLASPSPQEAKPKPLDIPALRSKAEGGDAESQLKLADLIFSGAVKDAKPEEAAALLEKAADSGYAPAQLAFSRLLEYGGAGMKRDPERSRFMLQQAAEAGHAAAQTAYASLLMTQIDLKGRDVNYEEPLEWFRRAFEQGEPEATCRLGMMRANGQGFERDPAAGYKLISKAARVGNALALNEAGIALQKGRGVDADPIAAVGYFHAAADLGHSVAMVNLGSCYRSGNGVPQDTRKAMEQFERAARANFGVGHYLIGDMLEKGEGVAPDRVAAGIRYARAARAGYAPAKERYESLKSALSEEQIKKVEQAVSEKSPAASSEAPTAPR